MFVGAIARDYALRGQEGVIWIVLPTTGELPTMWRKARRLYPDDWITDKSGSEKAPNFLKMNDVIIQFRSADRAERLVAEGLLAAWLDEAGIMLRDDAVWSESIRPTLMDHRAPALITGTPKGQNKFFELFSRGRDPEQQDYASFHWTSYANPFIPAEEVDSIAQDMPERIYRQEILAEFLDDSAAVFRGVDGAVTGYSDQSTEVVGVDLAKTEDFTVLVGLDSEGQATFFDRFQQISWPLQKQRIVSKARETGAFFLVDSTGVGDPILDDLHGEGVNCEGFKFTNSTKAQLVEGLEIAIEQQEIGLPDEDVLIDELKSFTYDVTRSGNVRYSAPEGLHDDCVMALGLARHAIKSRHFEILL